MPAPTALVTGASRGIGRAIALSLAAAGYDVAITARTVHEGDPTAVAPETGALLPGSLAATGAEIEAMGRRCVPVPLDLLDRDGLIPAIDTALDAFGGRVDVLVNNAIFVGPGNDRLFLDNDPAVLEKRIFANLTAQVLITHRVLAPMVEHGSGTVVNITSGAGVNRPPAKTGQGGWALGYAVSKGGFHRIADMLAVEYADRGIVAYNVNPGFVATERVLAGGDQLEFVRKHGMPPSMVGDVVAWLVTASDGAIGNGDTVEAHDRAKILGIVPTKEA
jgi:NAD(P)-dependent dehydrogenase (short-subunit alcohol dehydrogenase family)